MREKFEILFKQAINELRKQSWVPYDTGNLKLNAIKGIWLNDNTFRIYVDENVADYMKYTNEKWTKGTNPNEGWWQKAVNFIAVYISNRLRGEFR